MWSILSKREGREERREVANGTNGISFIVLLSSEPLFFQQAKKKGGNTNVKKKKEKFDGRDMLSSAMVLAYVVFHIALWRLYYNVNAGVDPRSHHPLTRAGDFPHVFPLRPTIRPHFISKERPVTGKRLMRTRQTSHRHSAASRVEDGVGGKEEATSFQRSRVCFRGKVAKERACLCDGGDGDGDVGGEWPGCS